MTDNLKVPCQSLTKTKLIYKCFEDTIHSGESILSPQEPLFHYTSISALEGIIASRSLRFTNIFTQDKDPYEIRSGMEICYQLLDESISKSRFTGTRLFVEKFKKTLQSNIEDSGQYFLFCTSLIKDDPHQWVHFGDNGKGVCLEFSPQFGDEIQETKAVDNGISSNGSTPVSEVFYSEDCLRQKLQSIIRKFITHLELGLELSNPDKNEGLEFMECMSVLLTASCIIDCINYKPKKFEKEKEVRFLRIISAFRTANYLRTKKINGNVKVYLELPLKEDYLKAIWLGPLVDEKWKDCLEAKLAVSGFSSIKIKKSNIFTEIDR